jgi:hypothetical protein
MMKATGFENGKLRAGSAPPLRMGGHEPEASSELDHDMKSSAESHLSHEYVSLFGLNRIVPTNIS